MINEYHDINQKRYMLQLQELSGNRESVHLKMYIIWNAQLAYDKGIFLLHLPVLCVRVSVV